MTQILLVDDDVALSEMLKDYLEQEEYTVTLAHDGQTGSELGLSGKFDLVILDVMMPGMNGIEVLRNLRSQSRIPVLMLTAKGDDIDRIIGLELGADDYVPKPCSARELIARLRAILRRVQGNLLDEDKALVVGKLALWPEKRKVFWDEQLIVFTSTEFNLLEVLVRHAGKTVAKQELSEEGLGRPLTPYDRSLDVHISSIRQKLRLIQANPLLIETIRGIGYQMVKE